MKIHKKLQKITDLIFKILCCVGFASGVSLILFHFKLLSELFVNAIIYMTGVLAALLLLLLGTEIIIEK